MNWYISYTYLHLENHIVPQAFSLLSSPPYRYVLWEGTKGWLIGIGWVGIVAGLCCVRAELDSSFVHWAKSGQFGVGQLSCGLKWFLYILSSTWFVCFRILFYLSPARASARDQQMEIGVLTKPR